MKQILDKLQEIKIASDHSFGVFFIFVACCVVCGYLSDIKEELKKNNTLLKTIINQQKDTINIVACRPNMYEKVK